MNGFMFSTDCDCGGELRELTHSKPDDFMSSCRVICTVCGEQWSIEVTMCHHRPWNEDMARIRAAESLVEIGARN